MSSSKKIAVVGDGPIGNLVIAKLLIEHHKNSTKKDSTNKNTIQITHFTSERLAKKGYTRRHILFITDELVEELEQHILDCKDNCLKNIANNQKLQEYDIEGEKIQGENLLFSTRLLEQTLFEYIDKNSKTFCTSTSCEFQSIKYNENTPNYYEYDYVFFAIGVNSGTIRNEFFYDIPQRNNLKIITPLAEPIIAFYSELGTSAERITREKMMEDKKSNIKLITKEELSANHIDMADLERLTSIINTLYDKIEYFILSYITRKNTANGMKDNNDILKMKEHAIGFTTDERNDYMMYSKLPKKIQDQIQFTLKKCKRVNMSLYGFDNFDSFTYKYINGITILKKLFNISDKDDEKEMRIKEKLYETYIAFLDSESMRPPIDKVWLKKIINDDASIIELLNKYIDFIFITLKNIQMNNEGLDKCTATRPVSKSYIPQETYKELLQCNRYNIPPDRNTDDGEITDDDDDTCGVVQKVHNMPEDYWNNYACLDYKFLVNVVQQSLDNYGIYNNNKLVYAVKKNNNKKNTNFFMIGDMANAYPAGISVEIGINFVNYIIPIFYNFYINEEKTILKCKNLNIVELLQDLLSAKYSELLQYKTSLCNKNSTDKLELRCIIESIKNYYKDNMVRDSSFLCYDDDIFLTYYNIVLLIQFIKNVDLIIKNKKILAISKVFKPSNYTIIDTPINNNPVYYNEKLQSQSFN